MFVTHALAHHPFVSKLLGAGEDAWTSIRLTATEEWFYVTYVVNADDGQFCETAMFATVTHLVDAFRDRERLGVEIRELSLVSQLPRNNSEGWRMEVLSKIWRAKDSINGPITYLYELANGNRYSTSRDAPEGLEDYELLLAVL